MSAWAFEERQNRSGQNGLGSLIASSMTCCTSRCLSSSASVFNVSDSAQMLRQQSRLTFAVLWKMVLFKFQPKVRLDIVHATVGQGQKSNPPASYTFYK